MSKKTVKTPELSGIASLLDNPIVEGYQIKEWSISQFSLLYPILKSVVVSLQDDGLNLDNAEQYLENNLMNLIDSFIPILPELLEVSLRLKREQVEDIPATTGSILGLAILQKNMEHIKSFLSQIKGSQGEPVQHPQTI